MKENQKGVPNERRRQSLRIQKPDSIAKRLEPRVHKSSKKSKKSKKSRPVRAQSVESLSASDESEREGSDKEGSEREVINSVLVPTIGEQTMLARIIDEEREKNIWWKELYELDQAARGVLPKNKDKEKVTFAEGSSSNSGLDSRLQGLEERILEFMGEGFFELHVTVETKLEALGSRMSHIEKNQQILKRRAKKMEDKLTSIESKVEASHGEDMDFRQWDYGTYEEKEKANSEKDKTNVELEAGKENDNIENTEQEAERKNDEEGEEKEADDNAQQEDEKEKENSEADEQDKEDSESESESETDELKQLKEICRAQADKLWKEIEADEEEVGGKHDEEEGEEKEVETSDEEKENSEDDEKVEEKVVESEAEGEDDQAEVKGKEDQEEEVERKESETREQDKEKSETDEVEYEAREAEIEKGTPTSPRGNHTEETPKDNHNEPRVETNRTDETPIPPRGNQTKGTPTPPRGRTKAMAARRLVTRPMEGEPEKGVEVVAEEAVDTEEKAGRKLQKRKKRKRLLGKLLRNILRKKSKGGSWSFTRKHRVFGSCIGARRMPMLLYLRRVADQRGNHSGCRLLSRRGRNVKQNFRLMFGKLSFQVLPCPKMSKIDN
ncbi:hypothetical protein HID58_071315 [Brassica napus]|uniref:Uncharacterized protein n=1 Tax=Brassica napus TaxID=3708 RepID=A0ABQ7Z1B9_BRANA|nr:hypothetical protein HID58_071315 [Brassica napus]